MCLHLWRHCANSRKPHEGAYSSCSLNLRRLRFYVGDTIAVYQNPTTQNPEISRLLQQPILPSFSQNKYLPTIDRKESHQFRPPLPRDPSAIHNWDYGTTRPWLSLVVAPMSQAFCCKTEGFLSTVSRNYRLDVSSSVSLVDRHPFPSCYSRKCLVGGLQSWLFIIAVGIAVRICSKNLRAARESCAQTVLGLPQLSPCSSWLMHNSQRSCSAASGVAIAIMMVSVHELYGGKIISFQRR